MAGAASAELAAAVSNAGALGGYGAAGASPEALRETIQTIRQATDGPFNINLFTPTLDAPEQNPGGEAEIRRALEPVHQEAGAGSVPVPTELFGEVEEKLAVVIEERVPVVSIHFGTAGQHFMEQLAQADCKVISTATSVEEARLLEQSGVDAIIAQGLEAGGHQGTFRVELETRLSTLTLLPAIVDAVSVPVIAAGGIADGRGLTAAFALGASGAQLGTAFLACTENSIHSEYRRALLESNGEQTVMTTAISGRPARGLRNKLVELLEPLDRLSYPQHYSMTRQLRQAASKNNDREFMAMWAGMAVGKLEEELPAAAVIGRLVGEFTQVFEALSPNRATITDAETTEIEAD